LFFRRGRSPTRFFTSKRAKSSSPSYLTLLLPGQFFGEGCPNGHALRVTTASAINECLITRIGKVAMIVTMHDETEFSELFTAYLLTRNSWIEDDLIDQLFNSSEKRLARLLLLLANFGKEVTPQPIIGKFSQETLAEMIGTTRSRVSFFMNKLRKLGYIEYNEKLEIHNSLLNVVLYNKPEIKRIDTSGRQDPPIDCTDIVEPKSEQNPPMDAIREAEGPPM
jgi:CRP/FNR family cyclic AMP-dependent transcriptional regulator